MTIDVTHSSRSDEMGGITKSEVLCYMLNCKARPLFIKQQIYRISYSIRHC